MIYKKYLKYIILSLILLIAATFYRNLSISIDSKATIQDNYKSTTTPLTIIKNVSTSSPDNVPKIEGNITQQVNKSNINNQKNKFREFHINNFPVDRIFISFEKSFHRKLFAQIKNYKFKEFNRLFFNHSLNFNTFKQWKSKKYNRTEST